MTESSFEIDTTTKHFVPRFYLRGSSSNNSSKQIHVFDKQNPTAGVKIRSIER